MAARRRGEANAKESSCPVLVEARRRAEEYFYTYLVKGRRRDAALMKARTIGFIRRAIARGDGPAELLWLQLADLYVQVRSKEKCLRQALRISPKNPEAHGELALIYGERGKKRTCLRHCETALRNCSGYDIEDVVVSTVKHALAEIGTAEAM